MDIIITILARAGSKGLPGKNTKEMNGKPLLQHTIDTALSFSGLFESKGFGTASIVVSTDDEKAQDIAMDNGLLVINRPAELAGDETPKLPAINHAVTEAERLKGMSFEHVIDLDVTNPMRTPNNVLGAYGYHTVYDNDITVGCVAARRSPYFNMAVEVDGRLYRVIESDILFTRQSTPMMYEFNCNIYVYKRGVLTWANSVWDVERLGKYMMPDYTFQDIDSLNDFLDVQDRMRRYGPFSL